MSELARRSGLGKATLSRWESGQALPDVASLDCVLRALNCAEEIRLLALALIPKPRAALALKLVDRSAREPLVEVGNPWPGTGAMLKALRLDRGWSREQAAAAVGASPKALGQWEQDRRRPSDDVLARLARALGAGEAELQVLLDGSGVGRRPILTIDEAREELEVIITGFWKGQRGGARLRLALMAADVWRLAQTDPRGPALLGQTRSAAAFVALATGRTQEGVRLARQARDLPYEDESPVLGIVAPGTVLATGASIERAVAVTGEDLCRRMPARLRVTALAEHAIAVATLGDRARALDTWREFASVVERNTDVDPRTMDHTYVAVCLLTGDLDAALGLAEGLRLRYWIHRYFGHALLGCAWELAGDEARATECLRLAAAVGAPGPIEGVLGAKFARILSRFGRNAPPPALAEFLASLGPGSRSVF
jgi:transcriptional regulator with XRE-family HTH domain